MPTSPEVLVIGAGIIGASIAWHLTAAGASVTVLDAGAAGGVATPASFAWINASAGNPEPYVRLRRRSMAEWRRLAAAVPDLPLRWCGGLCWDQPREALEAYVAQHGAWGYGVRAVEAAEIADLEPNLADPPDFAVYVAEEGAVEPKIAAERLLADAQRRGARLLPGRAVIGLLREGERVTGVETSEGHLHADEVVVAAGAATASLAANAGFALPMTTPPGLLVHSRPHAPLLRGLVMAPPLHMRQTLDGRIVAASDFGGDDPGPRPEAKARAVLDEAKALLRGAADLAFDFFTIGYRPLPADGYPAIGRPPGLAGLYVAVLHSGITLAPAVGLFAARELLDGRRDPLLAPYAAARFG